MIRQWFARHERFTDILVLLFWAVPQGVSILIGVFSGVDVVGSFLALVLGFFVGRAILRRRSHPVAAYVWSLAAGLLFVVRPSDLMPIAICIALFAVAVYAGVREGWIAFGVAAASFTVVAIALDVVIRTSGAPRDVSGLVSGTVTAMLVTVLIGINIGNRKRYIAALVDRAAQLVRERDQQAQLATAAERSRIAREMHDIVAHSLSVMVRLADGAEAVADTDREAALGAVRNIGATGRKSLAEMRRLLGVLREEEGALAETVPQPTLAALPDLVESYRAAGLPVRVETVGVPPTAEGVQVAVYRSVQECLTNALRYARQPTEVFVRLDYGAGFELTVTDDGAPGPTPESVGSERGLIGLAERAALYGGTVESGRLPNGGWRVRMTMPQTGEDEV